MALTCTASTDLANCGNQSILTTMTVGTVAMWIYMNSSPSDGRPFQKGYLGGSSSYHYASWSGSSSRFVLQIHRATTDLTVSSNFAGWSFWGTGKWLFVAMTWDLSLTNTDQHLYAGSLTNAVVESTSYASQTVGAGAMASNSGDPWCIGNKVNGSNALNGAVHSMVVWTYRFGLGELRAQQFDPHVTPNCAAFWYPGSGGTGQFADLSGNGSNGTITGSSITPGAPLPSLFRRSIWLAVPAGTTVTKDVTSAAAISTTDTTDIASAGAISTTRTLDVTSGAAISLSAQTDVASAAAIDVVRTLDVSSGAAIQVSPHSDVASAGAIQTTRTLDVASAAAASLAGSLDVTSAGAVSLTGTADVATSAAISLIATIDLATSAAINAGPHLDVTTVAAILAALRVGSPSWGRKRAVRHLLDD
ncbi:MAG: hypothetical protein KGL39_05445 [Patescibacteria group bacterium]|nr:hypothetical protein [Patescibacteria group bacterium]